MQEFILCNDKVCEGDQVANELTLATTKIRELEVKLAHAKVSMVGLWATDRPDLLTEEEKKKCFLFELK